MNFLFLNIFLIFNFRIKFLFLSVFLVLSSQKCIFHKYSKIKKISKINLKTNKNIEDYHPLNIFVDYSNIINQKQKSKLINELNNVLNILNQLISIKNVKKKSLKITYYVIQKLN